MKISMEISFIEQLNCEAGFCVMYEAFYCQICLSQVMHKLKYYKNKYYKVYHVIYPTSPKKFENNILWKNGSV